MYEFIKGLEWVVNRVKEMSISQKGLSKFRKKRIGRLIHHSILRGHAGMAGMQFFFCWYVDGVPFSMKGLDHEKVSFLR